MQPREELAHEQRHLLLAQQLAGAQQQDTRLGLGLAVIGQEAGSLEALGQRGPDQLVPGEEVAAQL